MSETRDSSLMASSVFITMILAATLTWLKPVSGYFFFLGKIGGGGRLAAIDNLQPFEPRDSGRAVTGFAQTHFIDDDHDAIVVGHEALRSRTQSGLNAGIDSLAFGAEERADVGLKKARAEFLVEQP